VTTAWSAQYRQRVHSLISAALTDAGFPFRADEEIAFRRQLMEDGSRIWTGLIREMRPRVDLDHFYRRLPDVRVSPLALPRVLGFGYHQGLALCEAIANRRDNEGAEISAVLNLGVVLYDVVCDRLPESREVLEASFGPASLRALMAGDTRGIVAAGDSVIRVLQAVVVRFFERLRLSGGSRAFQHAMADCLESMYLGEMGDVQSGRWLQARRKSVLPTWAMALSACRFTDCSWKRVTALKRSVLAAGRVLWIVDDMVDAEEDLASNASNRSWLLLSRTVSKPSLRSLLESEIPSEEAARLTLNLRRSPDGLQRILAQTCHAWLSALSVELPAGSSRAR